MWVYFILECPQSMQEKSDVEFSANLMVPATLLFQKYVNKASEKSQIIYVGLINHSEQTVNC